MLGVNAELSEHSVLPSLPLFLFQHDSEPVQKAIFFLKFISQFAVEELDLST